MLRFIAHLLGKPYESIEIQILREQIHILQKQNEELLHTILTLSKPEVHIADNKSEPPKPVLPKFTPWSVTQKSLEQKDRERFNEMMKRNNPEIAAHIDELEKDLGVSEQKEVV